MHRWTEFPGLAAAVKQVNDLTWSDLQGIGIPGRAVKFNIPKFDDSPSTSNAKVINSDTLATGPIKNREQVKKHIKDEFEDELEEGEIMDEIKEKTVDEPGVSLDIGPLEPQQDGYSNEPGFGDCAAGSVPQSIPRSSVPHPGHPRVYWHGLPDHYSQPIFTPFYALIPYYSVEFPSSGPDDSIHGKSDTQLPCGASYPRLDAFPPRLRNATPPRIQPPPLLPSGSFPPAAHPNPSSNLIQEPSPAKMPPSTSPSGPTIANQPERQQRDKRKPSTSTDTSTSVPRRPLKRRRPVASDFWSDDDEPQYNRSKKTLPANGVSDFGTWFQEQVTGSKKKLSHLEHVSAPPGNKKGT